MALRLLPLGRLTRRRNPLAMYNVDYTYTDIATEAGKTTSQIASVNNDGVITSYTYDTVGNITSETTGNQTISYAYDALNQLIGVTGGDKTYAYTYDGNGNLLTAQKGSVTNTYTYGDTTWKDLLTAYNGQTITYDEIGNPLTYRDGITFTWKNGRKLASIVKNDVTTVFDYNESGGRRMKMVGETPTFYQYVDGVLYAQYTGDDVLAYTYDDKGVPYMVTHMSRADIIEAWGNGYDIYALTEVTAAGDHYYYQYNMQGDVVGLMDIFGNQVAYYTYDPWGQPLSVTDAAGNAITSATHIANLNPIRYRGYHYDTETGLYYVSSRYYDPEIGRWINADGYVSTGQGVLEKNMFAYCLNNPVNMVDPSGEIAITTLILIGSIVAGVAVSGYTAYTSHKYTGKVDWNNTILSGLSTFAFCYTYGMSAYGMYVSYCDYKGYTPVTNIGSAPKTNPVPYSNLQDPSNVAPGKDFTASQKAQIIQQNKISNNGVVKSDLSGKTLVPPQKSMKGVTPPTNEWQIDHIIPKSAGGTNSFSNAQVLSREENRIKWDH